jgi:2,4-diketo-3-deoxy-L-fuconate hydrolase
MAAGASRYRESTTSSKDIFMKFMRVGPRYEEKPIVESNGTHYDISEIVRDIDPEFWSHDGPGAVAEALSNNSLPEVSIEGLRIGAPISAPSAVICIGQNYAAHAAESGADAPEQPIIFFKTPNTICGPFDAVGIPPQAQKFDWEVELCVVIGTEAAYLESREQARSVIGGFLVANDLSEREYQAEHSGGQWSKGKCIKDSMPLGPFLVTADAIDPQSVRISSWVNGEQRQDSNTSDMIFPVDDLVWRLSQYMQLEPGDIISTGTPEGVALSGKFPYLKPGDVSEVEIEGLGRQRQEYFQITVPEGAGAFQFRQ